MTCLLAIGCSFFCCQKKGIRNLDVTEGKKFNALQFTKIWETDLYGRWCLACRNGVVGNEILDRNNREYKFILYNYAGNIIKERRVAAGQGPDEIQVIGLDTVWLSPSGKIHCIDNDYLKTIDPETLEIETLAKLSNAIDGYGSRFTLGRISGTSLEERDGRIVTSFESSGFPYDFEYYLVGWTGVFEKFSVFATGKKEKPWTLKKLEESRGKEKLENYVDYYGRLRLERIFSVDWKRGMVYLIPDIEKPEVSRIDLANGREERYRIDIDPGKFKIEREEFDSYYEYAASETPDILKQRFKSILYIPPHAPALMGVMVIRERLLLITGNRNWKKGENQALIYRLPDLGYEGSFFIPYSDSQKTKWYDPFYINVNRINKDDGYSWSYEIYRIGDDLDDINSNLGGLRAFSAKGGLTVGKKN